MFKILLFLSIVVGRVAYGAGESSYFLGQGGYSQLNQKEAASNNVYPTGMSYGAGAGMRSGPYEFEAVFLKANLSGEIDHDGQKNTFEHSQTSLILAFNFYFTKNFYARFGYGVHKVDQTLGDGVSAASQEGAEKAYGLKEDKLTEGIVYGAGFVFYDSTKLSLFTQFENMTMSTLQGSAWNLSLGFRYYLK
jgi:hypothetical protein